MSKHLLVELDRKLAYYESGDYHKYGPAYIGDPIISRVQTVRKWLREGKEVKIFTARVAPPHVHLLTSTQAIQKWCEEHIGQKLPIVYYKDRDTEEIWDDRAFNAAANKDDWYNPRR